MAVGGTLPPMAWNDGSPSAQLTEPLFPPVDKPRAAGAPGRAGRRAAERGGDARRRGLGGGGGGGDTFIARGRTREEEEALRVESLLARAGAPDASAPFALRLAEPLECVCGAVERLWAALLRCVLGARWRMTRHGPGRGGELQLRSAQLPRQLVVESDVRPGSRFADHFALRELLGVGASSRVHRARRLVGGRRVRGEGGVFAAKVVSKARLGIDARSRAAALRQVHAELDALSACAGHPCVLALACAFEGRMQIVIVLEHCAGGELFDFLVAQGALTEADCACILAQVCAALCHVHACGYMHRDVKPGE